MMDIVNEVEKNDFANETQYTHMYVDKFAVNINQS